jgi:hypothetical protein
MSRILGLLALVLVTISAFGQVTSTEQPVLADFGRPRFMVYYFTAEPDVLSEEEHFVLYNSILAAAAAANPDVVVLESPDTDGFDTKAGREELAGRINADSWLLVEVSGGFENLTIQVETFDILRQETFGREIIRPGFVVNYRLIARGFWGNLVTAIAENYVSIVDVTELTISGEPGTLLAGIPGGPYQIDQGGSFGLWVPYPSSLEIVATARGFYDLTIPQFVGIEPVVIDLPQVAKPRFGVDAVLNAWQFPGTRFWYFIRPAEIFMRTGLHTQFVGLYPLDNTPQILVFGWPLSFWHLDAGAFLLPAEQSFRMYAAVGGYLRVIHARSYFGTDRLGAAGAVTASVGIDYSPNRRLHVIAEYQPAFILTPDPQEYIDVSFVQNRYPSGRVPGHLLLDWGLFDLRSLFLGIRWDFR